MDNELMSVGWHVSDDAQALIGAYVGLMMLYKHEDAASWYLFSRPMSRE